MKTIKFFSDLKKGDKLYVKFDNDKYFFIVEKIDRWTKFKVTVYYKNVVGDIDEIDLPDNREKVKIGEYTFATDKSLL